MLDAIEKKAARAGRRALIGLLASIFIAVGLAFATCALWIILAVTLSTFHAAAIIGVIYVGLGLILLGVKLSLRETNHDPMPSKEPEPHQIGNAPPLVEAFLFGLRTGSDASRTRHS